MNEPPRQLIGVARVVAATGLGRSTVKRLAARGELPATKLGRVWRFSLADVEAWIASGRNTPQAIGAASSFPEPAPNPGRRRGEPTTPGGSSLPPLSVLFPDAPWRGVHDELPATRPVRLDGRRRARAKRNGSLSAN